MEKSVKTTTGKEFEVSFCVATYVGVQGMLYIEFIGYSMLDIVPVFANPAETSVIEGYIDGQLSKTFKGYTFLGDAFIVPENGNLRIRLDYPLEITELK